MDIRNSDPGPDPASDGGDGLSKTTKRIVIGIAIAIVLLAATWYFLAPAFQPIVYDLVMNSPLIVFYWVPLLILGPVLAFAGSAAGFDNAPKYVGIGMVAVFALSLTITMPLSMVAENEHLADRTADKMDSQTLGASNVSASLPAIDDENMRNVPLKKAEVDANNNFQKSKFRLSDDADITYIDGKPYWSWALIPDSGGERWSGYQNGSVYVSQTDSDGEVFIVEGDVKNGQGVQFWRTNKWNLQRTDYWYNYQEPFQTVTELPNSSGTLNGETKIARPLVTHSYHVSSTPLAGIFSLLAGGALFVGLYFYFPFARENKAKVAGIIVGAAILTVVFVPYAVPSFAGVALQDSDGNVNYIDADEIQEHPELHDDNVYPYWLAKDEIMSLNWGDGIINYVWEKNGLFVLGEPDRDYGNSLPYTVQGADGTKDYYIPASPQGGGDGLKHVFIMDGQTGTVTQYQSGDTRMVGSQNVGRYVQGDTPPQVTTWEEFQPVEPLPVPHNGNLYWQVRILPTDGTGMPGYAFINASQTDDIVFAMGDNKDELARQFARGEDIDGANGVTQNQTDVQTGDGVVTQIVVQKNGEVVGRFNVTDDTSVEFEQIPVNTTQTNVTASD